MRTRLFLLLTLLMGAFALSAQNAGITGVVVDAESGQSVSGATVILEGAAKDGSSISVYSGTAGDFLISNAEPGNYQMKVVAYGFNEWMKEVSVFKNDIQDYGSVLLKKDAFSASNEMDDDLFISESLLEDEEGNNQSVGALTGASDNVYYKTTNYEFNVMRFRFRGYDQDYSETYINGVNFSEPIRGRFNYSMIGGMNQAFKNRSTSVGLAPSTYGMSNLGGVTNINTFAKDYAPGFRASAAYTNANYYVRGMVTYSTGLMSNGWALTASVVGRYAHEGVYDGTFYNSGGAFLSLQKELNDHHSLSFVLFGAPTERASNAPIYEECADLAGSYRYNPNWGYQDGEKRSAKVVQACDPTFIANWIWSPKRGTELNTGVGVRYSMYASSALNWYNAPDPRPDYYRYLPSHYKDNPADFDFYTDLWKNNESARQIDWNSLYDVNALNNYEYEKYGTDKGSTYMVENRHSNQLNFQLNSTLNHRLNDFMTLQAGLGLNHTTGMYYKTVKDLLGGRYWLDIDQFAERDFPSRAGLMQNDLRNPNRRVLEGDKFGYDYNMNVHKANLWAQNMITLPRWDINYGVKVSYTTFQRDGKMSNGRGVVFNDNNQIVQDNSYGKGKRHNFVNGGISAGATYKIDGRNNFVLNAMFESRAPLADQAYISPRIKDTAIKDLESEIVYSGDLSYVFNYRAVKGIITGFYTCIDNATERSSFYDDQYKSFMHYAMTNVKTVHKGIEFGISYNIIPSLTLSAAGTFARYQYKSRPTGTRSYENGMYPDIENIEVRLKNFYVGGTPQQAYNIGIDWAAPGMWFFNINASWMGDSYVNLSPVRHEKIDLTKEEFAPLAGKFENQAQMTEFLKDYAKQEKLNNAFVLNASIGKVVYLNRTASLNFNLNVENILNNKDIQTGGFQQSRFDYKNWDKSKFPNKYYYAQGIKFFFNVGVRF